MRWVYGLLALLEMALIVWLSSRPGDQVGLPPPWDKAGHGLAYAALGWLWAHALGKPAWAWGVAVLFGITDEWHQSMVPGRVADIADWLADAVGAALGVWLARRLPFGSQGAPQHRNRSGRHPHQDD